MLCRFNLRKSMQRYSVELNIEMNMKKKFFNLVPPFFRSSSVKRLASFWQSPQQTQIWQLRMPYKWQNQSILMVSFGNVVVPVNLIDTPS